MSEFVEQLSPRLYEAPKSHRTPVPSTEVAEDDINPAEAPVDSKILKRIERRFKRRGRLPLKVGATAVLLQSLWAGYNVDVAINMNEAAESQPDIRSISQEYIESTAPSTIFYLAGFDTKNGDVFANKVGITLHQIISGEDASIDYGNAPLEPEEIAKKIISYAEDQNLTSISLAGNSLGGLVAAKVAEYIVINSYLEVDAIILNSTPDGSASLRPDTQGELASLIEVLGNLEGIDAKYSTIARYVITLLQENKQYMDEENPLDFAIALKETSDRVWARMDSNQLPGVWTLLDQAFAVSGIKLENTLATIGEQRGDKKMPVILYMRPTDASDDRVVDVETSGDNTCSYAEKADISCTIVRVDGALHTSYLFNTEAYTKGVGAVADDAAEAIAEEDLEFALTRQSIWNESNFDADSQ